MMINMPTISHRQESIDPRRNGTPVQGHSHCSHVSSELGCYFAMKIALWRMQPDQDGANPLKPNISHVRDARLINTVASARWENARTKQQLFQQFTSGTDKPLIRLPQPSALHRAETAVLMRGSIIISPGSWFQAKHALRPRNADATS